MNRELFLKAAGLLFIGAVLAAQTPQPTGPGGQSAAPAPSGTPGIGADGRGFGRGSAGRGRGPLGGAAAGFVQNPEKDKTPPELPADLKPGGVLIISKTSGFREEAGIQASDAALSVLAKQRGLPYFVTENGAVMNAEQLARFKLVIWNNNSGDILNDEPERWERRQLGMSAR